jgi:hypothetical protein
MSHTVVLGSAGGEETLRMLPPPPHYPVVPVFWAGAPGSGSRPSPMAPRSRCTIEEIA